MSFLDARSFENGKLLIAMLSTYWEQWFPDQHALTNMMNALGASYYESHLQTEEMFNTLGVSTVPVKSKRNWRLFTLSDSVRESSDALKNLYGGGLSYGGAVRYGDLEDFGDFAGYPLPDSVDTFSMLFSGVTEPSRVWVRNVDYWIDTDRRVVLFREDPLDNTSLPIKKTINAEGVTTDRTLHLWARDAREDKEHIYTHYGFVLNVHMASSTNYRTFVEALWRALVQGPAEAAVSMALSALTGIPFAAGNETVVAINHTSAVLDIITTDNVYSFKPTAAPLVAVGDALDYGDALVDSVRIVNPGPMANWDDLRAVSLGPRFMTLPTQGPVMLENKDIDLAYAGTDAQGRTIVRFDVQGWPGDADAFWDEVHRQGVARGNTLAQLLDTRVNKVGEPEMDDLPEYINPFEFVFENIFSSNMYVIVLKQEDFADGAPGISAFGHLVEYLPAHTGFMIFVEVPTQTDYYTAGDASDADLTFIGGLSIEETVGAQTFVDHGPTIRAIPENCR